MKTMSHAKDKKEICDMLAQEQRKFLDFIGRMSVTEMKQSGIEVHDICIVKFMLQSDQGLYQEEKDKGFG